MMVKKEYTTQYTNLLSEKEEERKRGVIRKRHIKQGREIHRSTALAHNYAPAIMPMVEINTISDINVRLSPSFLLSLASQSVPISPLSPPPPQDTYHCLSSSLLELSIALNE